MLEQIIGPFEIVGIVFAVSLLILLIKYFVYHKIFKITYNFIPKILLNSAKVKIHLQSNHGSGELVVL